MPQAKKAAQASNKPTQSAKQPSPEVDPVEERTVDAMEAAVIASLVKDGVSFADAKAKVLGGAPPQQAEEEIDVPPKVAPAKSNEYSNDQQELMRQYQNIDEQTEYEVTFAIPARIYQWVIMATLQNAHDRNDPDFVVANFLVMLLKEQRAIDPTKGGSVHAISSGLAENFDGNRGGWG